MIDFILSMMMWFGATSGTVDDPNNPPIKPAGGPRPTSPPTP